MKSRWMALNMTVLLIAPPIPAFAQNYTNVAMFAGGAGSRMTNSTYSVISSWRQPTETKETSSQEYVNRSGIIHVFTVNEVLDTDGDGIVNEDDPDNDNDGLSDVEEITGARFDPPVPSDHNDPDSDDDGATDWEESVAQTNPRDPSSVPYVGRPGTLVYGR